jgi:hypothetical protein
MGVAKPRKDCDYEAQTPKPLRNNQRAELAKFRRPADGHVVVAIRHCHSLPHFLRREALLSHHFAFWLSLSPRRIFIPEFSHGMLVEVQQFHFAENAEGCRVFRLLCA